MDRLPEVAREIEPLCSLVALASWYARNGQRGATLRALAAVSEAADSLAGLLSSEVCTCGDSTWIAATCDVHGTGESRASGDRG